MPAPGFFCCCEAEDKASIALVDANPSLEHEQEQGESPELWQAPARHDDDPARIFTVTLHRDSAEEPWGLRADFADERVLHICGLTADGRYAVQRWNDLAEESRQIRVGDYFLEINGVSIESISPPVRLSDAMRGQLGRPGPAVIRVSRPQLFEVAIDKRDSVMGLELSLNSKGSSLVIVKIGEGAVRKCASESIFPGDRIVGVGNVEGVPETLLEAIGARSIMLLKMSRPYPLKES